jgi:hypothetical protein
MKAAKSISKVYHIYIYYTTQEKEKYKMVWLVPYAVLF